MQHFLLFSRCVSFTLFLFFSFCMHFFSFYFLFLLAFAFDCVVHFFFFFSPQRTWTCFCLAFLPLFERTCGFPFFVGCDATAHWKQMGKVLWERWAAMKERMRKKAVDWSSNAFFFVDRVGDWGLAFGQVSFYGACLFWLAPPALCFKTQKSFF